MNALTHIIIHFTLKRKFSALDSFSEFRGEVKFDKRTSMRSVTGVAQAPMEKIKTEAVPAIM